MNQNWSRIIGENIRIRRIAHKLSLGEVGETLGVSYQQVQKYEKGRNRLPSVMLVQLACLFGCTTDELCGLTMAPMCPETIEILAAISRVKSPKRVQIALNLILALE